MVNFAVWNTVVRTKSLEVDMVVIGKWIMDVRFKVPVPHFYLFT